MDLFKVSAMNFFYLKGRLNQFQHLIQHSKFAMLSEMLAPFKHLYFILAFIKEKKIMLDGVVWNLFQIKVLIQHFLASNAKNTIRLKRINDVLFKLEMSVGNESNYSTFPDVELSQIQYSNFQNPPINHNPCPMTDVPYSTAGGSSNLTTQWKMCQHKEIPILTRIFLIAQSDVI